MNQLLTGFWVSQAVHAAAKLGLPDQLTKGSRSAAEVAAAAGTDPGATHRLLRALASVGLFTENERGSFGLTELGALLTSAHPRSMRALATMIGEVGWEAWGQLTESVRTGETAFRHAYGDDVFAYLAKQPAKGKIFHEAMTGYVGAVASAAPAAYDFAPYKRIVDIGGGQGALLASALAASPSASGVLFDLPEVVAHAKEPIARAGLAGRCEIVGGDFFAAVPSGGDLYLLASIVHDWDDERSLAILRSVRRAIAPEGRLLLVELVIPPGDAPAFGKWMDLQMLVVFGGKERTEDEYRSLLQRAGFQLDRVIPTQAPPSLLEARPV